MRLHPAAIRAAMRSIVACFVVVAVQPAAAQPEGAAALWPDGPAIEAFLRDARVVDRKRIGTGITNPEKATLELNGVTRFAVLKYVDKPSDNWSYEVAAYELDKLLGLGHVPPTVARSLRGRRACLQLWVEGRTLEKLSGPPPDLDAWRQQVSLMWLFDDLIANVDRHLNNAIITPEFRLAFIDNSKSFREEQKLLNNLNAGATGTHARYWFARIPETSGYAVTYPQTLVRRLREVTDDDIKKAIGRHASSGAVRRLLQRRQLILKRLDEIQAAR